MWFSKKTRKTYVIAPHVTLPCVIVGDPISDETDITRKIPVIRANTQPLEPIKKKRTFV